MSATASWTSDTPVPDAASRKTVMRAWIEQHVSLDIEGGFVTTIAGGGQQDQVSLRVLENAIAAYATTFFQINARPTLMHSGVALNIPWWRFMLCLVQADDHHLDGLVFLEGAGPCASRVKKFNRDGHWCGGRRMAPGRAISPRQAGQAGFMVAAGVHHQRSAEHR